MCPSHHWKQLKNSFKSSISLVDLGDCWLLRNLVNCAIVKRETLSILCRPHWRPTYDPHSIINAIIWGSYPEVFCKKGGPTNYAKIHRKTLVSDSDTCATLRQVFSCKFHKIFKNTFSLQDTSDGCFWII